MIAVDAVGRSALPFLGLVELPLNVKIDQEMQKKRIVNAGSSYEKFRDLRYRSLTNLPKDITIAIDHTMVSLTDVFKMADIGVNLQRDKPEEIFADVLDKLRNQVGSSIDTIEDQLRTIVSPEVDGLLMKIYIQRRDGQLYVKYVIKQNLPGHAIRSGSCGRSRR